MEDRNAFFVGEHKNDDANFSASIKKAVFSPDNCKNDISLEEIILLTLKD